MPLLSELNYLDVGVALTLAFFLIRGLWVGFMRQLAAFFALIGSYMIAARYADEIVPAMAQLIEQPKLAFFASFILLFLVSALIVTLIGKLLQHLMHLTMLGWVDRLAGALLGVLKAAIFASLIYMFLASAVSAANQMLATSYSAPYLQQGSELLRKLINDPRLRNYLEEKKSTVSENFKQLSEEQLPPAKPEGEKTQDEQLGTGEAPASEQGDAPQPEQDTQPATPQTSQQNNQPALVQPVPAPQR